MFGVDAPTGAQDNANPAAGAEIAMGPGAVVGLSKGEKAVFADPKRPNTAYEPFVMGILKLVGMGLNLPVELLTKAFNSSYSASKAALLDAWQHFRTERAWLVLSFCQPIYETWMAEAVATGRIAGGLARRGVQAGDKVLMVMGEVLLKMHFTSATAAR